MALALYRRYRPDTFEGVIGQDQVTVPLMHALDENKLTHAYLFSGPRGCGKTSSARILARCINCVKGPTSHPCGECDSCRDLATGGPGSIDVVEIDAASHNSVDDARELRERAGFAPVRDRYKIFILDEAHMVTPQGFNALLKIVEEPPEHLMFIFATTEPDKVIGTIRSRTHHYPFRLVPPEIMTPYLEHVCEQEHIETEPGVLRLVTRAGGGSVRDTLSVLDQLMGGCVDNDITYDSTVALLGFTPDALLGEAIDAIIEQNGAKLYGIIQKVIVAGFDARRFVEDLLVRTRDLLVLTLGGDEAEHVLSDDAEAEDMSDLHRQADALGLQQLTAMAEIMDDTLGHMAGAASPRMRLELLAAKLLAGRASGLAATTQAPALAGAGARGSSAAPSATQASARGGFVDAQRPSGFNDGATAPQSGHDTPTQAAAPTAMPQAIQAATTEHDAGSQPQAASNVPAIPEDIQRNGTVDERWDAIVAALPLDVRAYINRERVPRVMLAMDRKSGRQRLWIKFETPLDKYAFALAVSKEPIGGTTSVVSIVRTQVHNVFGPDVALAPTEKMANGESAPPLSKLPPEEAQRIKAKLLQQSLQGIVAHPRESSDSAQQATTSDSSNDAEAHQAAGTTPTPTESFQQANGNGPQTLPDDDPWAQPVKPVGLRPQALDPEEQAHEEPNRQQPAPEHQHKHVAVPDVSDGIDPWSMPVDEHPHIDFGKVQSIEQQHERLTPAPVHGDDPWSAMPNGPQGFGTASPVTGGQAMSVEDAYGMSPQGAQAADAGPMAGMGGESRPPAPQVDADDDVYSMDDAHVQTHDVMDLKAVEEFFDVTKVEHFAADDANNPLNVKPRRMEHGDS
ncbi:DNA polymerase III subunit gamma/tau [Bifidobacterium animalis subsp. lactis]|uniref:DNA polymerase III subunit gamma/tau n=1 Tax=Bifidobacterium animalis TaxID=28025 RepID=UPI001CE176DB|nr:DNA polymerase III subunit gamma/tau [Bifidobacterium animalis]UBZ01672.1 DNA polymerase III subunit gamma/tau [Bifidobacterium animalis subsp. lactis]